MSPLRPPHRCPEPMCPQLVYGKGRCPEHRKKVEDARRAKETWRDYGGNWKYIRARVLKAEPYCRMCGDKATEVDHIISLKDGGTHDLSNLRPLCRSCHSRRTYYDTIKKKG